MDRIPVMYIQCADGTWESWTREVDDLSYMWDCFSDNHATLDAARLNLKQYYDASRDHSWWRAWQREHGKPLTPIEGPYELEERIMKEVK